MKNEKFRVESPFQHMADMGAYWKMGLGCYHMWGFFFQKKEILEVDYVGGGDIGVINYHASWILNLHDGIHYPYHEIKWCECLIGKK